MVNMKYEHLFQLAFNFAVGHPGNAKIDWTLLSQPAKHHHNMLLKTDVCTYKQARTLRCRVGSKFIYYIYIYLYRSSVF